MSDTTGNVDSGISHATLVANRNAYANLVVQTVAFGAYVVVATMTIYFLQSSRKTDSRTHRIALLYTVFMLLTTIAWFVTVAVSIEALIVETPASNSGELTILNYCSPTSILSNVLSTMQFWGSDALVIWRMYVIFNKSWVWTLFPALLFFANLSIGVIINLACDSPAFGGRLSIGNFNSMGIAFYALTASMNLFVTIMIGGRLLLHRRRTNKMFAASRSSHDAGKGYVTIVGILAESAVLYSSCCLIFVVFLQTNSPALNWWGGPLSAASFLCQSWIILRMAMGTSVSSTSGSDAGSTVSRSLTWAVSSPSTRHANSTTDTGFNHTFGQDYKTSQSTSQRTQVNELELANL